MPGPFRSMPEGARSAARGGDPTLAAAHALVARKHGKKKKKKANGDMPSKIIVEPPANMVGRAAVAQAAALAPHETHRAPEEPYIENNEVFGICGIKDSLCRFLGIEGILPCISSECPGES